MIFTITLHVITGKVAQEIGEKLGLDSAFRILPWMLESKFKVHKGSGFA